MDRKSQKRKEREKKVREKRKKEEQKRLEQHRERKKFDRLYEEDSKIQERLECEILLLTLGIVVDSHTLAEARHYLDYLSLLESGYDSLGKALDELFLLAHGLTPKRYPAGMGIDYCVNLVIKDMRLRPILEKFEARANALFQTRIGTLVCDIDDIGDRLEACCEKEKVKIEEWITVRRRTDQRSDEDHKVVFTEKSIELDKDQELDEYLESDGDIEADYDYAKDSLISVVVAPIRKIERWRLGVPTDFYQDVFKLVSEVAPSSALFFLRHLYDTMASKEVSEGFAPMKQPHKDGVIRFRHCIEIEPEKTLPDPQYLQELKAITKRLDQLDGGQGARVALMTLHDSGLNYGDALTKLERLGTGQRTFSIIREMLSSSGEWKDFLLHLFCEYPYFVPAYEALRALHYSPEQSVRFLCDFGDYQLNGRNLAETICALSRKPEAIKLIVENALYFCCGEGSQEMIALVEDLQKGTRALRHYMYFAKVEEPYKQLAVLRYVRSRGVEGLDELVEYLRKPGDEQIGEILREDDQNRFIERIATFEVSKQELAVHRLKALSCFDMISRYELTPEMADVDDDFLQCVNTALLCVKGSRYESILLGQRRICQMFMESAKQNPKATIEKITSLPQTGNPYLILKEIFEPASVVVQEEVGSSFVYKRVILIFLEVHPDVLTYLDSNLMVPIHVISPDAAVNKFNGIQQNDMVIYDTTRTGHSSYYRAKNLAVRRGAQFRHASRPNKEALLETIRS